MKTFKQTFSLSRLTRTGLTLMLTGLFSLSVGASPRTATVRDVNSSNIDPSKIVVPESFETDVHKMMTNWYIRNYTVLDEKADSRPTVEATDQDYIDRLAKTERVIELPFNSVVKSFIKMYVERKKGLVETMLGMSLYYMPIFETSLAKYDLPFELKYLPVIESALNPNAVSRSGAAGLWQFMPTTATDEGLEVNSLVDERRDPYRSSDAAARYLKKLYTTFGDWSLAIAAYNCGPGNVTKAIKRAGGGTKDYWQIYPYLPSETRDYIPAYIAAVYAMENFGLHGISPALAREPITIDTVHVTNRIYFQQISDVLDIPMDELRILNPQYRQDFIPGHVRPYSLALPHLQVYNFIAQQDTILNHDAEKYARRDIVQPSTGAPAQEDQKGEYVTESVTKYHKVKRGETLASIAKRYGVTESSIQKNNKLGNKKTLKRGQTLKIITTQRVFKPAPEQLAADTTTVTPTPQTDMAATNSTDSVAVTPENNIARVEQKNTAADTKVNDAVNKAKTNKNQNTKTQTTTKNNNKPKPAKPATTVHKVQSGENLWRISNKYGLTVDEVKAANGLKNDNLSVGQELKIPAKGSSKTPAKTTNKAGSTKKKTTKRRR